MRQTQCTMNSRLSFQNRLTAGFGLLLGFVVGIFVASYIVSSKLIDSQIAIDRRHAAILEVSKTFSMLKEAQAACSAYVLTGDGKFVQQFERSSALMPAQINTLMSQSDEIERATLVQQIADRSNVAIRELSDIIQIRKRDGFQAASIKLMETEHSGKIDQVRGLLAALETDEKISLSTQLSDSQGAIRTANSLFLFLGLLICAGFFLLVHRMYSDMAYRQQVEEQIRQSEEHLKQRASELAQLNEKLVESERLKSEFVATVSHELRTPLTLILAPLESMIAGDAGKITERQKTNLQIMHNNSVRLLQLISGLLDFSRLDAGKVAVNREQTDIASLTQTVLSDFQHAIDQKNLTLSLSIECPSPLVLIDRYLYERILFNLISNALKFTNAGGNLTVRLSQEDTNLTLSVQDSGIGIAAEDLESIFQKFKQVDAAATRRFEGTGLGLALVAEFAALLGGGVSVTSTVGSGSRFQVTMQALLGDEKTASPDTSAAAARAASPVPRFVVDKQRKDNNLQYGTAQVLVAEDNTELAAYIASVLEEICQVTTVNNGLEALDALAEGHYDLIILDVMMPEIDGLTACKEIKSNPRFTDVPIVLLTALTYREALLKGWEAGADEYLFKPFHPKELTIRIQSILRGAMARRESKHLSLKAERLERTQDFLATVAHDLTVPLRGSTRMLEMMLSGRLGDLSEEMLRALSQLKKSHDHLLSVTGNLVEIYSFESGHKILDLRPAAVGKLVEDVFAEYKEKAEKADLNISRNTAGDGARVKADPGSIALLLKNLLDNAIRYTPAGGEVVLTTSFEEGSAAIEIFNSALIAEEDRENLFQRFWQGVPGKKFVAKTGLGLYLCKTIVEAHQGSISSHFDNGTTIEVLIPLLVEEPPEKLVALSTVLAKEGGDG